MRERIAAFLRDPNNDRWLLWGMVLLGLVLRFHLAATHNLTLPDSPSRLHGDEPMYDYHARSLLSGEGFTWPDRAPLYPLWLAALHWLTHDSYDAMLYVQGVLGLTPIPLTYVLARRIVGRAAALLAALGVSVNYVLIRHSGAFLSEILFTPVLLIVCISLVDAMRKPTTLRVAWAGLWVGISALVRPTLFLFPIGAAIAFAVKLGWRAGFRVGTVYAAAAWLTIAPWTMYNALKHHAFVPIQTSNAFLWLGSPEYYHLLHDRGTTYTRIWDEVIYGPGWRAHDPTSPAGDRWWTRRALRSIAAEPLTYLKYDLEKAGMYWVGHPGPDWYDSSIFSYGGLRRAGFTPLQAIQLILARTIPILALVAALYLRRRWRAFLPLYAVLLFGTFFHAATFAAARHSEPLQPLLLILIAAALIRPPRAPVESLTPPKTTRAGVQARAAAA